MKPAEKPDFADTIEAQLIADYVSDGETLKAAGEQVGMHRNTIYDRMQESSRFREMMERARERGYDVIAEECLSIAEDGGEDWEMRRDRFGGEWLAFDKEHVQRSKLRIETRLKLLAKWHPKKYGEKLQVEQKSTNVVIPMTDDPIEAQRAYEELMKNG